MAVTIPVQFNCNSSRISFDQKGIAGPIPTLSLGLNLSIPIPALVEALADFQRQHDPWGQIASSPQVQPKPTDVSAKQLLVAKAAAAAAVAPGKQPPIVGKGLEGMAKSATWQQAPPPPAAGSVQPGKLLPAFPGQAAAKPGAVPGQPNPAGAVPGAATAARVGPLPVTGGPLQQAAKAPATPGKFPGAVPPTGSLLRPAPGLQAPDATKPEDGFVSATEESSDAVTLLDSASGRRWDACSAILSQPSFVGVNAKSRFGRTVLHYAAWDGRADICKALIERPDFTEINAKECYGRTALHCAALTGHADVCRLLLSHPGFTELDARDRIGNLTAVDLALRCGHHAALEVLREASPGTDVVNSDAPIGSAAPAIDENNSANPDGSRDASHGDATSA